MTTTVNTTYDRATVQKTYDGLSDVVTSIYVIITATDDDTGIVNTAGELITLDPPESTNFIPFDELSKETVDSWFIGNEQYQKLEDSVIDGLQAKLNPVEEIKPLPFS